MSRTPVSAREVRCPACGKAALFAPSNPFRPFCSERCRQHDFGAWASENYRVGASGADSSEEQAPPEH